MSFPYLDEVNELTDAARAKADGAFIALSAGITHYELRGNPTAPVVVLVHGFSVPAFIYDRTFSFLVDSGLQVLRYDLLGRGYSDRPNIAYNIDAFVDQLRELLDGLHLTKVALAGLSMGGPITAAFITDHANYVTKHILIDPAGARRITLSYWLAFARIPLLSELAFGLLGSGNLVRNIAGDLFDSELVSHFQARYRVQMQYKGFKRAILSTIRNNMLESFESTYTEVGKIKIPTLLIWGRNDETTPFAHSSILLNALPHAEFHVIENCGHIPHYERPEIVNPILLEFLSR